MAAKRQASDEDLIKAGALLMQQIFDAKTIGETLRLLLIERRVFSNEEYLAKYDEVAARLQQDLQAKVAEAQDDMASRLLQRMPLGRGQ